MDKIKSPERAIPIVQGTLSVVFVCTLVYLQNITPLEDKSTIQTIKTFIVISPFISMLIMFFVLEDRVTEFVINSKIRQIRFKYKGMLKIYNNNLTSAEKSLEVAIKENNKEDQILFKQEVGRLKTLILKTKQDEEVECAKILNKEKHVPPSEAEGNIT